jgi:propionate CoA-transferase
MGKAQLRVGDGKLVIEKEGTIRKFVSDVEQITFSGKYAQSNQTVLYVTERCVFRLVDGKMTLVEIARVSILTKTSWLKWISDRRSPRI